MEEEVVKKKIDFKKIIIIVLMAVIGLILLIFVSTYFRWQNDISSLYKVYGYQSESKILYEYKNVVYEVENIKDFYGEEVKDLSLKENEYVELYCDKSNCTYIDKKDSSIMTYLNPGIVILALGIFILVLFFIFEKLYITKTIIKIISLSMVVVMTVVMFFVFVVNFADYYGLVNNSTYLVKGNVIGGIYTSDKTYNEVLKYEIRDNTYYILGDKNDNSINDVLNQERNIYYNRKDYNDATVKRLPINILFLVSFVLLLVMSILYGTLLKREKKG